MPGNSLFIESLNFQNLEYKEPVLLAALALEKPVLLIGEYGCSNNKLLERLSKELDISFHNCFSVICICSSSTDNFIVYCNLNSSFN